MNKHLKELFRSYKHQEPGFKQKILGNRIEKTYCLSSTQTLHLCVGTHNLELAIPFDTYLDRELLNWVILCLVQQQGLMRSVLINHKGRIIWQQHAAPEDLVVPYLDISLYSPGDQERILSRIRQEKSLGKFTTHSWLYRSIVVKDVLMMYLKKYLNPRSVLYRVLVKITSLARYLRKNCRGNSLLYRMLLVGKNLREHLLLIRLDHIIGDDNSLELIRNSILQYYNAGKQNQQKQVSSQKIPPYDGYVEQVNQGPRGITPQQLVDFLEVEEYKNYSTIVGNFIDRENTKQAYYFNYHYPFKGEINLKEEQSWEIGFILVILLCREIFNIPKIPAKLIYYGRNYGGSTYFNTIGEFWDLIPMLVDVNEEEPLKMVQRANELVELAAKYNINFVSMFLNETLYESWKPVIDLVAPKRLTPPESMILIDFLGKQINRENRQSPGLSRNISAVSQGQSKRRRKERYVNLRSQGGFLIYVRYTSEAVSIDLHSLVKINHPQLKHLMDEQARKILANIRT